MTERDAVPAILEHLRTGPVGVATPEETEAERQELVPWLEAQIEALPRQRSRYLAERRRRRALWGAGAAVLAAAAGVGLVLHWSPGSFSPEASVPPTEREDGYAVLLSGRLVIDAVEILPGSRLGEASVVRSSEEEPAVLRGSSGYVAELGPDGELALGAPAGRPERQELRLTRGEVTLSVPPLTEGSTLSVLTEDARITVRGTEFSVRLLMDGGAVRSCVRVSEGAVEVRRRGGGSELLTSGGRSGCESTPAAGEEATPSAADSAPSRAPRRAPRGSTLEQESQILASALAAEQAGDVARARRELKTLLRRYPGSPLASEARAALGRVEGK